MKVLHLTLKKKWFDMIASGEKKEEYREIKPSWVKKLCREFFCDTGEPCIIEGRDSFNSYDQIHFYNGWAFSDKYRNYKIECKGIRIGEGKHEWGAEPGKKYFVIELGDIIVSSPPTKQ